MEPRGSVIAITRDDWMPMAYMRTIVTALRDQIATRSKNVLCSNCILSALFHTKILQLPDNCKFQLPAVSRCKQKCVTEHFYVASVLIDETYDHVVSV